MEDMVNGTFTIFVFSFSSVAPWVHGTCVLNVPDRGLCTARTVERTVASSVACFGQAAVLGMHMHADGP